MMFKIISIALVSALAVGPATLVAVKSGVKHGFMSAFYGVFGITVIETIYANLGGLGISLTCEDVVLRLLLLAAGCLFFLYLSISGLRGALNKKLGQESEGRFKFHPFILGVLMTLPNPLIIVFWSAAFSSWDMTYDPLILSIGILIVGTIWAVVVGLASQYFGKFFTNYMSKVLDIITLVILFLFAIRFLIYFVGAFN